MCFSNFNLRPKNSIIMWMRFISCYSLKKCRVLHYTFFLPSEGGRDGHPLGIIYSTDKKDEVTFANWTTYSFHLSFSLFFPYQSTCTLNIRFLAAQISFIWFLDSHLIIFSFKKRKFLRIRFCHASKMSFHNHVHNYNINKFTLCEEIRKQWLNFY